MLYYMLKLKLKIIFNFTEVKMKSDSGYNTRQKENLLDFLINNKERHTSVQEISAFLTNAGTPMGMATIYRQLDKLVENGVVRRYVLDGKSGACYQYIGADSGCHEHYHLKCVRCGKLIHFDCDFLSGINRHILEHHGFNVDSSQTVFYGKCSNCSKGGAE